jgi:hypothetical protein
MFEAVLAKNPEHTSRSKRNSTLNVPADIHPRPPQIIEVDELFMDVKTTANIQIFTPTDAWRAQLVGAVADTMPD